MLWNPKVRQTLRYAWQDCKPFITLMYFVLSTELVICMAASAFWTYARDN